MPKPKTIFNQDASFEEAEALPKEKAVRHLINSGVEEFKRTIKTQENLTILTEALRREQHSAQPRTGILKPLQAKINRLNKAQGNLPITIDNNPEILKDDPWHRARAYHAGAQRFARAGVACQVMLGFELTQLKKDLGFTHGGKRKKAKPQAAGLITTWEQLCKAQLGISDDTARRFITIADAAKKKLKSCFSNLPLLEKPVTEYNNDQLELLNKAVDKITDGETQTSLLREWGIAKKAQGSGAKGGNLGSTATEDKEPTMEQLAFSLFKDPSTQINNLREHSDYQKCLFALPIISSDPHTVTLTTLEQQAQSYLTEIQQAKTKRMETTPQALPQTQEPEETDDIHITTKLQPTT